MAARQPSLLRTAYLLTGDRHTAEDLVQTALAKLYLSLGQGPAAGARSTATSAGSSSTSTTRCGGAPWKRREHGHRRPARAARRRRARRRRPGAALWALVQTLPRKQRAVVVLRYYEELCEAETAAVLGISVGTVKSQASRALAALRSRVRRPAPRARSPRGRRSDEQPRPAPRSCWHRAQDRPGDVPAAPADPRRRQEPRPRHPAPPVAATGLAAAAVLAVAVPVGLAGRTARPHLARGRRTGPPTPDGRSRTPSRDAPPTDLHASPLTSRRPATGRSIPYLSARRASTGRTGRASRGRRLTRSHAADGGGSVGGGADERQPVRRLLDADGRP